MIAEVLRALALVLVLEGVVMFIAPTGLKRAWTRLRETDSRVLRGYGVGLMVAGLLALQIVTPTS